jgi:hypothetical protein
MTSFLLCALGVLGVLCVKSFRFLEALTCDAA